MKVIKKVVVDDKVYESINLEDDRAQNLREKRRKGSKSYIK